MQSSGVRYRFQQGMRELLAFMHPVDDVLASQYLSPDQLAVFKRMQRSEQLHSLNVLRDVLAQENPTPHDLAVAALLHDVGKIRYPISTLQKTLVVLIEKLAPAYSKRWMEGNAMDFVRGPFVARVKHPAWGAERIAPTGASETTLWLIAHHADKPTRWHDHPYAELLQRLHTADNNN